MIAASRRQTPHPRPGPQGVMEGVAVRAADWALDYGAAHATPCVWVQGASGAFFKLLQPAEAMAPLVEEASAMLCLVSRCIGQLEYDPSVC